MAHPDQTDDEEPTTTAHVLKLERDGERKDDAAVLANQIRNGRRPTVQALSTHYEFAGSETFPLQDTGPVLGGMDQRWNGRNALAEAGEIEEPDNPTIDVGDIVIVNGGLHILEPQTWEELRYEANTIEGRAFNGWEWYPTPDVPGIAAQWIDPDEEYAVAVKSAWDGDRRGYKVIHGRADGGDTENATVYDVYGDPGQTPREVADHYYDEVANAALAWLLVNDPADVREGE